VPVGRMLSRVGSLRCRVASVRSRECWLVIVEVSVMIPMGLWRICVERMHKSKRGAVAF